MKEKLMLTNSERVFSNLYAEYDCIIINFVKSLKISVYHFQPNCRTFFGPEVLWLSCDIFEKLPVSWS